LQLDTAILTDSSSCASIKSPCKRDHDVENLSSLSINDEKTKRDFKRVMAKKMMQKMKKDMEKEMLSSSESEDNEVEEIMMFQNNLKNAEENPMLSFKSSSTRVGSVYNSERLQSMKKRSQRKLKKNFSQVVLGTTSEVSRKNVSGLKKESSEIISNIAKMKLTSMTSLHGIVEEKTPKVDNEDSIV